MCVLAGRAASWRHGDEGFTLGLRLPVRALCVACLWISFFVPIFPSTRVFLGQVPTPGEGGREGKSVEETGVSRPHLTVNPSPGCDPQGVYIHGLSPWRWSLVLRLWNENRLAGQTDRSQGCNVTHTAPSSWAAEPATCMIAFRNSELKRKIPSKILSHCCIPFTWECIEK